jgi:hypothetical protein
VNILAALYAEQGKAAEAANMHLDTPREYGQTQGPDQQSTLNRDKRLGDICETQAAMVGNDICVITGAAVSFPVRPKSKGDSLIRQSDLHGYLEGESEITEEDTVLT